MRSHFSTLSDLIQKVIQRLSMYNGTSVQVYAEDRIGQMILDNYDLVLSDFDWQNLTVTKKFTLSGYNGECIENVSNYITDFNDIICITTDEDLSNQLHKLHVSTTAVKIEGTTPVYYKEDDMNPNKIFQIVPYGAVGDIYVHYEYKINTNDTVAPEDIVPFDSLYLVLAACADYVADDDNSQTQYEKFCKMRDARLAQLKAEDNSGIIDLNDEVAFNVVTDWR